MTTEYVSTKHFEYKYHSFISAGNRIQYNKNASNKKIHRGMQILVEFERNEILNKMDEKTRLEFTFYAKGGLLSFSIS